MKKITFIISIITVALLSSSMVFSQKQSIEKEIGMFPAAEQGYKQVYIKVPAKKNESDLKVEVFVGKTMMVDCNRHFMGGNLVENNLEGWGYNYFVAETDGNVASTRMGCPDNEMKKEFVHMQSQLMRYNSKLPIVIYVPQDLEVQYRVWKAPKKLKNASAL